MITVGVHHTEWFECASKALLRQEYEKFRLHYSLILQTKFLGLLTASFHVNCIQEACYCVEIGMFVNSTGLFSRQFFTVVVLLLLTNTDVLSVQVTLGSYQA